MFGIDINGITLSNFEDMYALVLNDVKAEAEGDKSISVSDFVTAFCSHFKTDRIKIKWDPKEPNQIYEWKKYRLFNYSVLEILDGVCFALEDPILVDKIVDSGKRMSFGEGLAEREPTDGKGRYDLITPFGIRRLAIWYELGAKKYADRNWEKGMPFSRYIDAAKRHLDKYIMGMTDEDHLAAAAWNILSIMHHEELGQMEFDDMPHYMSDEYQKERLKKQLNALYGMKEEEKNHE